MGNLKSVGTESIVANTSTSTISKSKPAFKPNTKRHKSRPATIGEVRASFAYAFRIKLDDELLLVGNEHPDDLRFQPVGGGYRFEKESLAAVQKLFGHKNAPGTLKKDPHTETSAQGSTFQYVSDEELDFRLLVPATSLPDLYYFFMSKLSKEIKSLQKLDQHQQGFDRAHCDNEEVLNNLPQALLKIEPQSQNSKERSECHESQNCPESTDISSTLKAKATAAESDYSNVLINPVLKDQAELKSVFASILADTKKLMIEDKSEAALAITNDEEAQALLDKLGQRSHDYANYECVRETILDLGREFLEEVLDSHIIPQQMRKAFATITYCYRGQYCEYFYDDRFNTYSFFVSDVIELAPNEEQLEVLRYLKSMEKRQDKCKLGQYIFIKESEVPEHLIAREHANDSVAWPPIADHSIKTLALNFDKLRTPPCVKETVGEQALFTLKLFKNKL